MKSKLTYLQEHIGKFHCLLTHLQEGNGKIIRLLQNCKQMPENSGAPYRTVSACRKNWGVLTGLQTGAGKFRSPLQNGKYMPENSEALLQFRNTLFENSGAHLQNGKYMPENSGGYLPINYQSIINNIP